MASVKYLMKNNPSIYVRFTNGKMFDISTKTNIAVDPKYWDKKNQKIKNVSSIPNRDKINEKLALLKFKIINDFNASYVSGDTIDKHWLESSIVRFFKRPKKEGSDGKHLVYLSDFARWWLDEKASTYKMNANKYMDGSTKNQYEQALGNILDFQGSVKVRLKDVDMDFFSSISYFLTNEKKYAHNTVKRKIGRIKFFCARAEQGNIPVHKGYLSRVYIEKTTEDYKHPYLNEEEISQVYNYESHEHRYNVARDNWIIGLWTGLRVSDFLTRLKVDNINDGFIEIKTKKTGTSVAIPLHSQVKDILKKYDGNLPPKISEQDFNDYIKDIAKELGFNDIMIGGVVQKKDNSLRKVIGKYPKWKLITSHICRRSFCTNLFGKVPNQVIMDIAGWSNEKQMYQYNQSTNRESAIKLKEYWETK